ncbi:hypothetical protein ACJQWK_02118 [Exserohilum turcicum]
MGNTKLLYGDWKANHGTVPHPALNGQRQDRTTVPDRRRTLGLKLSCEHSDPDASRKQRSAGQTESVQSQSYRVAKLGEFVLPDCGVEHDCLGLSSRIEFT